MFCNEACKREKARIIPKGRGHAWCNPAYYNLPYLYSHFPFSNSLSSSSSLRSTASWITFRQRAQVNLPFDTLAGKSRITFFPSVYCPELKRTMTIGKTWIFAENSLHAIMIDRRNVAKRCSSSVIIVTHCDRNNDSDKDNDNDNVPKYKSSAMHRGS